MGRYVQRRVLISIPILVAITAIIFTLLQLTPRDPLDAYLTPDTVLSQQQRDSLRHGLSLARPAPIRFVVCLPIVALVVSGYRLNIRESVAADLFRRIGP